MTTSKQFLKNFVLERNYKMIFYAFVKIGTKENWDTFSDEFLI